MRIAWEASALLPPRTGVGRSAFETLRALLALAAGEAEFHLVWRSLRRALPAQDRAALAGAHVHAGAFPPGPVLLELWQRLGWPRTERFTGPVDLVHGVAGFLPPSRARARILTVMDLHALRHPEHATRMGGLLLARHLPRAVQRADRVVVPSEATARECVELLGVEPARLVVIPLGGAEHFSAEPTPADWAEFERLAADCPRGFWLAVGTFEPRKNFALIAEALGVQASGRAGGRGQELPAVLFLSPGGPEQRRVAERLRAVPGAVWRVVSGAGDGVLRCALQRAQGLVMPSLAEGFGLPLVEAMAAGCPVLCSDIPVFHEVTGGHARFFDPRRAESLAEAMAAALADPEGERARAARGRAFAGAFTWARTAQRTWDLYRTVLTG